MELRRRIDGGWKQLLPAEEDGGGGGGGERGGGGRKGKGVDGAEEIGYGLKLGRSSKVRGFGGGCAKNTIPMTDGGKYEGGEGVGGGILEEEAECPSCCWRH